MNLYSISDVSSSSNVKNEGDIAGDGLSTPSCKNKNSFVEPDSMPQSDEKRENDNLDSTNGECVNSTNVLSSLNETEKNTLVTLVTLVMHLKKSE